MSHLQRLLLFKKREVFDYSPISKSERGSSEHSATPTPQNVSRWSYFPWGISLICILIVLVDISIHHKTFGLYIGSRQTASFATGFSTDFVTARDHIEVQEKTFTGGPAFDEMGIMYIPHPAPVKYVGDPDVNPEIDENWERATWGRYVLITEEEARATWGDEFHQYWDDQRGGYVTGFDMFHTLHCLNNIRKAFRPNFYPPTHNTTSAANAARHMDHCIDQIRQYIMCSGDMTPIGTIFYPGLGRNYVDSDVPHTCRNFEKLRDWMVDRYDGPGAVHPQ